MNAVETVKAMKTMKTMKTTKTTYIKTMKVTTTMVTIGQGQDVFGTSKYARVDESATARYRPAVYVRSASAIQ